MNSTILHRLLDFIGLILGALITYDFTMLGVDPARAATISAAILLADNVVKLLINLTVDGPGGLFSKWDTNALHNVLNVSGVFVGSMLTFEWQALGFSPAAAGFLAGFFLTMNKIIKFALNINRSGIGGLLTPPRA